jgi:hypothetical protein
MFAKNLPQSEFGLGTPHGYVRLTAFGQRAVGGQLDVAVKDTQSGLCAAIEQRFEFQVNCSLTSARAHLALEFFAKRSYVRCHRRCSASLRCYPSWLRRVSSPLLFPGTSRRLARRFVFHAYHGHARDAAAAS